MKLGDHLQGKIVFNLLLSLLMQFLFLSNRRPPSEIPHDAIIVRSTGEPSSLFTPPTKPRKRKLGLGTDSRCWIEKIRKGDILPTAPITEKVFFCYLTIF